MDKKLKKLLLDVSLLAGTSEDKTILKLKKIVKENRGSYAPIKSKATAYISKMRKAESSLGLESFFEAYGLDSEEGIAILSLSEALLRVPDSTTANKLIHDKLKHINWNEFEGNSNSKVMKASSLGMKIVGKFLSQDNFVGATANPFIRTSIKQSMKLLGNHFVMGQTINNALSSAEEYERQGYKISYDMLGEGARSLKQSEGYIEKYQDTISHIQNNIDLTKPLYSRPAISIKLSAFHPNFSYVNINNVKTELLPKLKEVVLKAVEAGIPVTFDAEESERLDLCLELFTELMCDEDLKLSQGVGLAVQAYHKHGFAVIDYIGVLAKHLNKQIPVRLVKGAYWDAEIKKAQVAGLADYPVFTHKEHTDISYLACAYKMLEKQEYIYPQFATHNAVTISQIELAAKNKDFEFQLLHGMGKAIYDQIVEKHSCRIYAPVGSYKELLPYLIRRLLENSANSSFVKNVSDENVSASSLASDPVEYLYKQAKKITSSPEFDLSNSRRIAKGNSGNDEVIKNNITIPLPANIYSDRKNSSGWDFGNASKVQLILEELEKFKNHHWQAGSIIDGKESINATYDVFSPYCTAQKIGKVAQIGFTQINDAMDISYESFETWHNKPVEYRADILEKMSDLLERNQFEAIALCIKEAGKTIADSIAEVREAIDFCRYYALQARLLMGEPKILQGVTGEKNCLSLHGRGIFVCISPWNFPLAIFLGQVTAALVTGNTVIAKPAEQTPLIASFAVRLLKEAGLPDGVINLLLGDGATIGKQLLNDKRIAGVVFTGSNETATIINKTIALRGGAIIPFIAETGGQNAMIVDSTALIEQTVDDIVKSAFSSAGQRCSALRILYLQEDIADDLLEILSGAIASLNIGSPEDISSDLSCVIDNEAKNNLEKHIKFMSEKHELIAKTQIARDIFESGYFVNPHVFAIDSIDDLKQEVFGAVLHVIRYKEKDLDKVITQINSCGYGLTLGIQSRLKSTADYIKERVKVGNIYVNRNMIGATVGVQPFGGEGLSGTGFKAGGHNYLLRFVTERTYTVNTTAIGGNRDLLA
jgi:RHH-type proline utilization regulon transcriptional repressor/proline dehydrogenase/delta 1-pyrroline-5-carboxylate dehydrogenase